MELRVGCPMWAHKPWQGRYLPASLRRDAQLAAYASWCNAVEGNTTFYGVPSAATVGAWAHEAPPHLRFLFKLPRTVTHERRLRNADDDVADFLRAIEPLGERASTVAIQLPESFSPGDLGALVRFLRTLPSTHRWSVEVRHPSFFDGSPAERALERVLTDHDVGWTTFDTTAFFSEPPTSEAEREGWANKPRLPRRAHAVGIEPIVRYLGRDDTDATIAGWQSWLPTVAAWLNEGRRPMFFVHTPDNVDALDLARRFHDEVRALVPALDPLPEPQTAEPQTAEPSTLF
jgi:uncharacterized protein YecE (DUF72 family)